MKYRIIWTPKALRQMSRLDAGVQDRISLAVDQFADNPRPPGYKKLVGHDYYRLRVGDYRIIYDIHDKTITITVLRVGHRRDIYR